MGLNLLTVRPSATLLLREPGTARPPAHPSGATSVHRGGPHPQGMRPRRKGDAQKLTPQVRDFEKRGTPAPHIHRNVFTYLK